MEKSNEEKTSACRDASGRIHCMNSVTYLSLIFLAFTTINVANAERCYERGNFSTDSTYSRNRDVVLSSLASNVSENNHFFTTTIGQGENKVYGLVLCREDSTQLQCFSCVNSAIQGLKESCPYQKEAISWGGDPPCIVRYANRNFLGILEVEPVDIGQNVNNITSNMEQFDQVWFDLMERLVLKASMGTSKLKYASGEANLTVFKKIYAVMTCTPDLSQRNCNICLQRVVSQYNGCCHGKQGGYVQNPNCIFRWDLYPFYNSIAEAPAPASDSPPPPYRMIAEKHDKFDSKTAVIIVVPTIICAILLAVSFAFLYLRMMKPNAKSNFKNVEEKSEPQCQRFDFAKLRLATNNFSENNKLGQGGFGAVYKGVLADSQIIAVKRLSGNSKQGEVEFKNEVLFVARLQHRNLVRLLGFCLEGKERLLIYEFLPNASLDRFIFDAEKLKVMNWNVRRKIIVGIARGVLYLHEDSQLRIVHRDLKASNILLDKDMNPKISDFGLAKLVGIDESQETASRIVGTLGYMAPEYAIHGRFSVKSDVFSFGVLVLEIITGEKISTFDSGEESENLLAFAWKNWNKGTGSSLIHPTLLRPNSKGDIMKIYQIALLCVQENIANRPTMTSIMLMLDSTFVSLPKPSRPAYFLHSATLQENSSSARDLEATVHLQIKNPVRSINEASISEMEPR